MDRFRQFLQTRACSHLFFVTQHYRMQTTVGCHSVWNTKRHLYFTAPKVTIIALQLINSGIGFLWQPKDLLHTGCNITHTRSPYFWYFAQHPSTGPCRIPPENTVENYYSTTYHSSERPKRCNLLLSKQIEQAKQTYLIRMERHMVISVCLERGAEEVHPCSLLRRKPNSASIDQSDAPIDQPNKQIEQVNRTSINKMDAFHKHMMTSVHLKRGANCKV